MPQQFKILSGCCVFLTGAILFYLMDGDGNSSSPGVINRVGLNYKNIMHPIKLHLEIAEVQVKY